MLADSLSVENHAYILEKNVTVHRICRNHKAQPCGWLRDGILITAPTPPPPPPPCPRCLQKFIFEGGTFIVILFVKCSVVFHLHFFSFNK